MGMLLAISFVWSIMLGPQLFRQDLRQDLPLADLLKSYPLPGWQIVLGELLAPVAVLSVIQWMLVGLGLITVSSLKPATIGWAVLAGAAFGLIILIPVLNLVLFQIPNAAVLLFPSWFQSGKDSPQGIEATGQRIIFMLGQLLALVLVLLPAAIAGGIAFALFKFAAGLALAVPAAALAATVLLAAEAALGVFLLGKAFEALDISAETTA